MSRRRSARVDKQPERREYSGRESSGEAITEWCASVPKAELHLHLEGAIPVETLLELIRKYEPHGPVRDLVDVRARMHYRDFPHFIETWLWKNRFLREYEDFTLIAEAAARYLVGQRAIYAEMFFSPTDFARHGLATQELAQAIRAGLDRVPDVRVALVADLVRDAGPVRAEVTLSEVAEVRELGVVGIGIGGSEHLFPPEPFRAVFARARQMGFHTSAHAGESAGPESVWAVIRELEVERIGHATRAVDDERLLAYLAEEQIAIECCPISNVCTGAVVSLEAHPVRRFDELGLLVTINTDDPAMFGNALAYEYEQLCTHLGFSRADVCRLVLNAVSASWLDRDEKARLAQAMRSQMRGP